MVQYTRSTQQNHNERIDIRGLGGNPTYTRTPAPSTVSASSSSPPVSPASRKTTMRSPKKSKSTGGLRTSRRVRPTTKDNKKNVTYSPLGRDNQPVKSKSTPSGGNVDHVNQPPDYRKVKPYSIKEKTRSASLPSKDHLPINGSYSNAHSSSVKESIHPSADSSNNNRSSRSNTPTKHRPYYNTTTGNTRSRSNTPTKYRNSATRDRSRSNTPTKHRPYNNNAGNNRSRSNTPTKYRSNRNNNSDSTTTSSSTTSYSSNAHNPKNHCQTTSADNRPLFHHHSPTKAHNKPRVGGVAHRQQQQQQQHSPPNKANNKDYIDIVF